MDDELQSIAYAKADFSTSNQLFVDSLIRDFPGHLRTALDIGCGPGDVVIRLARAAPDLRITAVDGSAPMMALARGAVLSAGLGGRVTLVEGYVPGVSLAGTWLRRSPLEGPAAPSPRSVGAVEGDRTTRQAGRGCLRDGSRSPTDT